MSLTARPYTHWVTTQPYAPGSNAPQWPTDASYELIAEELRARTELREVGRQVFPGTLVNQNQLWLEYRNLVRQAMSNFEASRMVSNRSAGLLQYYSLLNFAKAELLVANPAAIYKKKIGHGLSFSPVRAKTVAGDSLTVQAGVFPLLYEARTGHTLPQGTKLGVKRLIKQIPEISTQSNLVGFGHTVVRNLYCSFVKNGTDSWVVIAISAGKVIDRASQKILNANFDRTSAPVNWKDLFGLSSRWLGAMEYYQSRVTVPVLPQGFFDMDGLTRVLWELRDVIGMQTDPSCDAWFAPSYFKTKNFPMPPAMARYAIAFYASSLVRYRPSMFDSQVSPAQALLFDAVSRETSLPMLQDSFAGLMGAWQFFSPSDNLRS